MILVIWRLGCWEKLVKDTQLNKWMLHNSNPGQSNSIASLGFFWQPSYLLFLMHHVESIQYLPQTKMIFMGRFWAIASNKLCHLFTMLAVLLWERNWNFMCLFSPLCLWLCSSCSKCWLGIPAGSLPVHWGKVCGGRELLQTHKKRHLNRITGQNMRRQNSETHKYK